MKIQCRFQKMCKRTIDLVAVFAGAIVLWPFFILLICIIRLKLGQPVFFSQVRPGLYGKPFTMYKFRTMNNARDKNGNLLADEERLTKFGRFLRATSLDELPEFYNVLKGEMSLVGPRPLLMEYLDRYTKEQARRHEVKPGITGWVQITGRNAISWEEKFKLDAWYVENHNLWIDMKILFFTIWQVISCKNISPDGHATMPEFRISERDTK